MRGCGKDADLFSLPITQKDTVNQCPILYFNDYYVQIINMIKTIFGGMSTGYTAKDYLNELAIIIELRNIINNAEADYERYKFKKSNKSK